ncbi:MAG: DUF1080 domain-containing protein [Cytophagaceae bacterium]|nr:DUF1080 domain-containing protein [Cytophagaceae bacterium]
MKINSILWVLLFFASNSIAQKSLFNGKNLDGWQIFGTEKWYVKGKNLVCESGPDKGYGYLATDKKFKDFELTLMFKPEANGNSGVFFHSDIEGTKVAGWQAEVAPPGHFSGGIYESYKRGWLIKPDPKIDNVKMNKWNTMKILVQNDEVTTWVNGVQMIFLKDKAIGEIDGKIALQIHDGGGIKVAWKKILIKEL